MGQIRSGMFEMYAETENGHVRFVYFRTKPYARVIEGEHHVPIYFSVKSRLIPRN